ncbi:calcium-transporting ATPase 1, plasma membrane-type-like protein [Cinnamomum micranthum f. kanehirae]|uniref:Calcium-transporting ATPase 1, plasma membrane-type-like protein n=1 Tax=Cinnamomum micranthum f. kanehirae TaxID=337451 RepID=A0A443NHI4_9MAGN|nr:calcium-transporting ATPase 1, plasma membrane-type-like protein [Cinnamomum micranthum f. kanehirae]
MEALQRCGVVKNRKRRFRFTANLTNRSKADAMRKMNQEKLRVSPGLQFIQGHDGKKLTVHGGVEGVANTVATSTTNGISKTDDELKHRQEIYGINRFTKAQQAWKAWKPYFPLPLPLCLSISSSLSLSLSIPLIVPLPFAPSISLLSLDLSRLISRLFSTAQQDTSSSSSSPASLQCYPSSTQEPFVPLQHPHHLSTAKLNHMRPSLTIAPTTTEEKLRVSPGLQFIQEHTVTDEVEAAGFQICADELGSIVEGHDVKKLTVHGGVEGVANTVATSTTNGISKTDDELKRRQEIYGINRFTKAQQAWKAWKPYFPLPLPLCLSISSSLSLSIPLIVPLPFAPSISLLSLDLSRLISRLFSTAQQDTSSSSSASPASSSPASLQCYPSLSQEPFVPLQHPHHLSAAKPNHMQPSLMIAPTATEGAWDGPCQPPSFKDY